MKNQRHVGPLGGPPSGSMEAICHATEIARRQESLKPVELNSESIYTLASKGKDIGATFPKPKCRYPEIKVVLPKQNRENTFAILGTVTKAMRAAGLDRDEITRFVCEAASGGRNHMFRVCQKWVTTK